MTTTVIRDNEAYAVALLRTKAARFRREADESEAIAAGHQGAIADDLRVQAAAKRQGAELIEAAANDEEAYAVARAEARAAADGDPEVYQARRRLVSELAVRLRESRRYWREVGEALGQRALFSAENNVNDEPEV